MSRNVLITFQHLQQRSRKTCALLCCWHTLHSRTIPEVQADDPVDDVLKEHVHSLTTMHADPHPAAGLPSDYAEQFFLHDTSRRGASKAKSSQEIAEEIEALKKKLTGLEKLHAEALAREAAAAEELATEELKEKELAALKEQEKETKAKQKQLEKEIKKMR